MASASSVDERRYRTLAMIIILQDQLCVGRITEFGSFTLQYNLLSNTLRLIENNNDKCLVPNFNAYQLA